MTTHLWLEERITFLDMREFATELHMWKWIGYRPSLPPCPKLTISTPSNFCCTIIVCKNIKWPPNKLSTSSFCASKTTCRFNLATSTGKVSSNSTTDASVEKVSVTSSTRFNVAVLSASFITMLLISRTFWLSQAPISFDVTKISSPGLTHLPNSFDTSRVSTRCLGGISWNCTSSYSIA